MIIKYPKSVSKNDTIGITAISSTPNEIKVKVAEENLKKLGFKICETKNVRTQEKLVSSSGKERAEQVINLWKDKNISHIIAARGGEFAMEMIPYMHEHKYELMSISPKWMQGYSDTSLINFYLTTNYNIATVHAQNLGDYAMRNMHKSLVDTLNMVKLSENDEYKQESYDKYAGIEDTDDIGASYKLIHQNRYKSLGGEECIHFEGRLIGGCIDVIKTIIGTPYDNVNRFCEQFSEGMIWYLENCEMAVTDLYRALWQMREAGWFKNVKGFLLGRTMSSSDFADYTYIDAIQDSLGALNIPVIYDVDIGHVPPQITCINGSYGIFEYKNGSGVLTQKYI